jgi:light-regulated signal transduction histidine kinase (bacteriophytochrome)
MGAGQPLHGRRKDGTEFLTEINLIPLETPRGKAVLASVVDVTERNRKEEELKQSHTDLEQFSYIVSHDLQEPLRMVSSYTELLAERYRGKLDEKADKFIFYAVDGAKRMHQMIAALLAYSRVGSRGKPLLPVSSEAALKAVMLGMGAEIRGTNAVIDVGPLPEVLADEGQLGQLFQHLIENAIKFRGEAPPHIQINANIRGDRWCFSIKDNGIGIDPKYKERIFQVFQRIHERGKYEGTGIGLSIAKRIIERHNGQLWMESQPGGGATFFFTLRPTQRGLS